MQGIAAVLVAALALAPAAASALDVSGTVIAVDLAAGTLVVGEVGPWTVKDGQTQITQRSFGLDRRTEVVGVMRAVGASPSGWVGGFMEVPLTAAAIATGDFVTVRAESAGKRLRALRVTIAE